MSPAVAQAETAQLHEEAVEPLSKDEEKKIDPVGRARYGTIKVASFPNERQAQDGKKYNKYNVSVIRSYFSKKQDQWIDQKMNLSLEEAHNLALALHDMIRASHLHKTENPVK